MNTRTKEYRVKLIRNEPIGLYSYDTSASTVNSGYGINEWSQADLMKLLNPGYESNQDLNNSGTTITVNNSLYWTKGSGTCYNGDLMPQPHVILPPQVSVQQKLNP
jgi:hypothetical protein